MPSAPAEPVLPLIVCGFPRSGTLTCAQALGLSPDVELQGEMGAPDQTIAYLEALKAWHGAHGARGAPWADKSYDVIFDVIAGAAPGRRIVRPGARYRGHKTPRHERYFDRYEALFDRPDQQARYVYCLREPWAVWRSLKGMAWNSFRDAGAFTLAWVKSVETWERMAAAAPDRVLLFRLDDFAAAPDSDAFVREALLAPLGLDPARLSKPVADLGNNNASTVKAGRAPAPLFQDEIERIGRDAGVRRILTAWLPTAVPPTGVRRGVMSRLRDRLSAS